MAIIFIGNYRKSLVESACDRWLKVQKDGAPENTEYSSKPGGESRFGIDQPAVSFFYHNHERPEFFFFYKRDLLHYLDIAKAEYYHPSQNYWNIKFFSSHYEKVRLSLERIDTDYIKVRMYARYDFGSKYIESAPSRAYLEFLSAADSSNFSILTEGVLSTRNENIKKLGNLNEIVFSKFLDTQTNKIYIYMAPHFTGKIAPNILGQMLKDELSKITGDNKAHVINLFGIKYAECFSEEDVDAIVSECGLESCKVGKGAEAKVSDILLTSLKSYELIKEKSPVEDPLSAMSSTSLSGLIREESTLSTPAESIGKCPVQKIYYGAPGTGKSNNLKEIENQYRITFHPDTDYAAFVGCYKPSMKVNPDGTEEIQYAFVPQIFLKAYLAAWNNLSDDYNIIIEEINRGNCAQIFGDVFQLLDRNEHGFSTYPITIDNDLWNYIQKENLLPSNYVEYISDYYTNQYGKPFSGEGKLTLPPNLNIYATMNTSDQSLFPIDSAFKRRWEWAYVKVNYSDAEQFTLKISDEHAYNWGEVLKGLNNYIKRETHNTNKILGNRFVKADENKIINLESFRDKVLFFLFGDVFKDDDDFKNVFFGDDAETKFFEDLCVSNDTELTIKFIENICQAKNISEPKERTEVTTE